jgi:hypothetical protein
MRRVTLELLSLTGQWMDAGSVAEVEPPGSLSSTRRGEPREVFLFGWQDGAVGVWRSEAGIDEETPEFRVVHTNGLDRLADLEAGPYTMPVWVKGREAQVRFRLADE